ncbi:MAG: FAD-dependent oxidoreductase [Verrucomicrobia bacterium]|nr:FAD-dependent oxidoreductase [Verrucomicrobiota bacterium]MCG2681410.1 FAD-dependent oxidoreductase [Kiritimatiellia bacterium]MBU4248310.1 FAD-dependent oxidoreductase [Verrucomicrobiota bacterium]MBU4289837.1 FAD-dependent oxidoreductase [Verrucomicrobiota bacterium]MBU4429504.1 FAD-dependent oxidoreductase [Verrucomicrobiota bacterium]
MKTKSVNADVCVVGGGMAGICAAISAARHGAKVVLIHDRPVYGGNASSEIRVGIIGADRCGALANLRETGLIEEIRLRNLDANPGMDWCLWDLLLYSLVNEEPAIHALMNATCLLATVREKRIVSVRAWQMTSETFYDIDARIFIDCSGDGILAECSGADYRVGREARSEFNEPAAPETADRKTMGMTCLFYARREDRPSAFQPPLWAYSYPDDYRLPYGAPGHKDSVSRGGRQYRVGYWWIEMGGEADAIHDTESLKHELLKIVLGVWDHIKNHGQHEADNFRLEWIQFLPGKREGRRIMGDYILTQNDCAGAAHFADTVAYGGWPMDDHNPKGFYQTHDTTIFHPCASPYEIPYRCLCSRAIENLMMAGRNVSVTHMALSSARVMATCAVVGQAVGTAAALAVARNLAPREIGRSHGDELQQTLMADDCYLPGVVWRMPLVNGAFAVSASHGDPAVLWNGVDRPVGDTANCLELPKSGWIALESREPTWVDTLDIVFDSDLSTQIITMDYHGEYAGGHKSLPATLVSAFRLSIRSVRDWEPFTVVQGNWRRLCRIELKRAVTGIRLDQFKTVGGNSSPMVRVFRVNVR